MGIESAGDWLGMTANGQDDGWRLPVTSGVISGASALFGGCATAAALIIVDETAPQPVLWASAHFGALAKLGSTVELAARTISSGRTMTHSEVVGRSGDRESFTVRVAAGDRPDHPGGGQWVSPPDIASADSCPPFLHPVHAGTWAERFDWRLGGNGEDARGPWAAWWVRPTDDTAHPLIIISVLADYVTYGVGRALRTSMGGLSIDNVLRIHRLAPASDVEWLLLEIRPEGIDGGFGHGVSRIFAGSELVASGSQSMVMNNWDWRLPDERDDGDPAVES